MSNNFINNARLKLVKHQGKAKEHPEAEFLLLENYLLISSSLSLKNDRYLKTITKNQVHVFKWGHVINDNEKDAENEKEIT